VTAPAGHEESRAPVDSEPRKWLEQRHADLLIGGELLKKDDAVSLWFVDKDPTHDWQPSTFRLDANSLKNDPSLGGGGG
jgi:hypothetical protein